MNSALYSAAPYKVVSMLDPAIDLQAMGKEDAWAYVAERDFSKLKFLPGKLPQVYHLRKLPENFALSIATNSANDDVKNITAFSVCLVQVDNLCMEDGTVIPSWVPAWKSGGTQNEILKPEESALFPMDERKEVGEVANKRSFLRQGRKLYLLPQLSFLRDLASRAQAYRLAVQSASQSEKHPEQDSEDQITGEPFAQDGDAIAKESSGPQASL